MRSRLIVATILAATLVPLTARAELVARTRLDTVLVQSPDPATLRARLAAYGESLATLDTSLASRAFGFRGRSFSREGEVDSAVVCQERALRLEEHPDRRMALAEALIARLDAGDAAHARDVLRPIQPRLPQLPDIGDMPAQAMLAWAHYLAGRADSAAILFAPIDAWLSPNPEWRYRLACVAVERNDWTRALSLLTPLAVVSRTQDADVMDMLHRAGDALNAAKRLPPMLAGEIAKRDAGEQALLADIGLRRVAFTADDRFPLGGMVMAPARRVGATAAVVIMAPGDTVADYDSLAIGLRRLGMAVMLLEPRGCGRSVSPTCPSIVTWHGRENEIQDRIAHDVRPALSALARETKADTSRYLIVGIGPSGGAAVAAAALDRRAKVLMLVSPSPDPVDRGAMRATLAALKRPVYFQTGPEDFQTWDVLDALYRATDQRSSRIADSDRPGHFATLFGRDPRILMRFKLWLAESWPRAPRPTPRAAPRAR